MTFANCQMGGVNMGSPDVCKTPRGDGTPPMPYPNIAQGATANPGTTVQKVLISGTPAHTVQTIIPMSSGDEPGVCGGVVSGMNMGPCRHLMGASNVLIGGMPATKMGDQTGQNGMNLNVPGSTTAPAQTKVMLNSGGGGGGGSSAPVLEEESQQSEKKEEKKSDKPVTTERIALLLVRYAVGRRNPGDGEYRYNGANLNTHLPKINNSQYVLRSLREGWVYVFCEMKMECFKVSSRGELRLSWRSKGKDPDRATKPERDALLFPEDAKEAMLAFSEHKWTEQQCRKVINDSKYRSSQMQSFSLTSPKQDTLPLGSLKTQVEEYAGRGSSYKWTKCHSDKKYWPDARSNSLKSSAIKGQHIAVLHDPLCIIYDLGTLIDERIKQLNNFVAKPDDKSSGKKIERYQKKFIADAIGNLYENRYSQKYCSDNNGTGDARANLDQLARLRLEYFNKNNHQNKTAPTVAELRRKIVTEEKMNKGISRLTKHVNERARQGFLNQYDLEVNTYQDSILDYKQDRAAWLSTFDKHDSPQELGSSWSSFDFDNAEDWFNYEASVAASISSAMNISLPTEKMLSEPEVKLIGQWLAKPIDESPIYLAIAGYTELKKEADIARDRFGAGVDAASNIIKIIYKKFPVNVATEQITKNLVIYAMNKAASGISNTKAKSIDKGLIELLGAKPKDAKTLDNIMMGRYGKYITKAKLTIGEFSEYMVDATRIPGIKNEIEHLVREGRLNKDGFTVLRAIDVTTSTSQTPIGERYPNPFLGWGTTGVSAFVAILNVTNIIGAVDQIKTNVNDENVFNLMSAFASLGGAINAGIEPFSKSLPRTAGRLASTRVGVALAGTTATRLFGYTGAFLTGITLLIRSRNQFQKNDTDSGMFYAAAAVVSVAGGIVLTEAAVLLMAGATPIGLLIIGFVLMATSLLLEDEAQEAKDTPIEIWLNNCTFGLHENLGDDSKSYSNFSEEVSAMAEAFYSPKVVSAKFHNWFGWEHYFTSIEIFTPGYDPTHSTLAVTANDTRLPNIDFGFSDGGRIFKYSFNPEKSDTSSNDPESRVIYRIEYRPNKSFKGFTLTVKLPKEEK